MIRKILKLQNVGLLQDATRDGPIDLAHVTAIYADNGRGKTTLAAVLRACQLGDAGRLHARRTIDATSAPEVKFLLRTGDHIEFTTNSWSMALPNMVIFDSEFVERNVYSGFEVRAEQRQSLLEFALGDDMVQLKQQIDLLTKKIADQTDKRTQAEKSLGGFALPYTVAQFIALQPVPDSQQRIDELQKQIQAAKSVQQLAARKDPTELKAIQFDLARLFAVLKTQIQDVEDAAEAIVKAHLAKHNFKDLEDWVSRGQNFLDGAECPFCGQGINGLKLISAYRSHFNKAYAELKQQITELHDQVGKGLGESRVESAISGDSTNTARIEAWKDQVSLPTPTLDGTFLAIAVKQLCEQLLSLVAQKQKTPLEVIGTQFDLETATATLASINQAIASYNAEIREIVAGLTAFRKKLSFEDIGKLGTDVKRLEAAQNRVLPDVAAAAADFQAADVERKRLDEEKTMARQKLDSLMQTTLQQYQTSISELLGSFGVDFSIEQLKPNYQGSGEPRTEYGLCLRNKSVKLGTRGEVATDHCFASTLSEADKRTLAFAFFVARLRADPKLADKLVVMDDPVSSLDRNRRRQTIIVIAGLARDCKQLLVLSHDPHFLREFRERLAEAKPTPIPSSVLSIKRAQNGYSVFAPCDIDDVCSSDYYRNFRVVADYVDGRSPANLRDVAKAIRPLLEGYYHRRFPRAIPRKLMFGQIIVLAANAKPAEPLAYLQPILKEMTEVNDYAGQFHHDPNPGYETVSVVDAELLKCANRALKLIYQNG